ncbi:Rossmann-like and DUF2520 domain-containing protein [Legionella israelensis]|uniref:Rossmann-like and DUF2520 domain-containing protein n=1 Tax=Legionella israelensis TaxID=454 RepID=UPI0007300BB8|nr:Rossmann-like and DUF2520 domain-containing protein [Legionella israelensis]QBS09681.1 DUF2520 domain-containing protein [Legionella israelensis]
MIKCNFIGAGRLGKNLALALKTAKLIEIGGLYNQHPESTRQTVEMLGEGQPVLSLKDLPAADAYFLTVPDDVLPSMVNQLIDANIAQIQHGFIIHCSGVLPSSILSPFKSTGCSVASLHPLKAFKKGELKSDSFYQVDCVLEGDAKPLDWLTTCLQQLNARIHFISAEGKTVYHAAAVLSSNYMVTLAEMATRLMQQTGIQQNQAYAMICRLMQSSLHNLTQSECAQDALTGPISRGDIQTVKLHLQALMEPDITNLYRAGAQATLPLAKLLPEQKEEFLKLLESV